jgi:hypothetical protein
MNPGFSFFFPHYQFPLNRTISSLHPIQITQQIYNLFEIMKTSTQENDDMSTLKASKQPTVITQAAAKTLLASRCEVSSKVEAPDSHFFHDDKPTQHQVWRNGGCIGSLKEGSTMPAFADDLPATTLQGTHTFTFVPSAVPFHTAIKKEYTVEPPETGGDRPGYPDWTAISRLFVLEEGIYAIRSERDYNLAGTKVGMNEADAASFLREKSLAFKWTGGNVEWHPFKYDSVAPSQQSVPPLC